MEMLAPSEQPPIDRAERGSSLVERFGAAAVAAVLTIVGYGIKHVTK